MFIRMLFRYNHFYIQSFLRITGGGGVGKSYLIITLAKWITKILISTTDPNKAKVLLLAFTGVAASLIGN
jgi:DNA replication protein DnaC